MTQKEKGMTHAIDQDLDSAWHLVRRNLRHYDHWEDCLDEFLSYFKRQADWPHCLDCRMEIRECNCPDAVPH
jgi:hypothetical protein